MSSYLVQVNVTTRVGEASQSVQFAPFDANYAWNNLTYLEINDPTVSYLNSYQGGVLQQVCRAFREEAVAHGF